MNAKITFVELVNLMADATSTSKRVCELFLKDLFATVSQALIDGDSVKIKGVGTFKVTQVKPRKSVNVNTGNDIQIAGYHKLTFTPDKSLVESVNQPFAQFETVFLDDALTDEKLAEIDKEHPSPIDVTEAANEATDTKTATTAAQSSGPAIATALMDDVAADEPDLAESDIPAAPLPFELPEMNDAAPAPDLDELFDSLPADHDNPPSADTTTAQKKPVEEKKPVDPALIFGVVVVAGIVCIAAAGILAGVAMKKHSDDDDD